MVLLKEVYYCRLILAIESSMGNISAGPNPEAALAATYIGSFQFYSLSHHGLPVGLGQVSLSLCQMFFHLQNRNNWSTVQLHGNIMKVK